MLGDHFPETLGAARAGADWAWTSIYRDLAPSVLGYLRGRRAVDPDDLTGEVFLQIVRDLHTFEGGERQFRAWVFAIAQHRLLDERRRHARRPIEPMPDHPLDPGGSGDPEEQALQNASAERVCRFIGRLPLGQREVLLLRILGDLTVEEVARVVGRSSGAVKALQRRGLEAIKGAVSTEGATF